MKNTSIRASLILASVVGLGACNPKPEPATTASPTTSRAPDAARSTTTQRADAGRTAAAAGGPASMAAGPGSVAPDNSAVNERDRGGDTLTPMDQSDSAADVKITQDIRQAVVGDDSLSFSAKNVKIITRDAIVTLRGPVASEQEKANIAAKAQAVAGVTRVDNQIEIEAK